MRKLAIREHRSTFAETIYVSFKLLNYYRYCNILKTNKSQNLRVNLPQSIQINVIGSDFRLLPIDLVHLELLTAVGKSVIAVAPIIVSTTRFPQIIITRDKCTKFLPEVKQAQVS